MSDNNAALCVCDSFDCFVERFAKGTVKGFTQRFKTADFAVDRIERACLAVLH
jgi:hypothetical protein